MLQTVYESIIQAFYGRHNFYIANYLSGLAYRGNQNTAVRFALLRQYRSTLPR